MPSKNDGYMDKRVGLDIEPVKFWTDVVKEDEATEGHCKMFLQRYVKASKGKRLILGVRGGAGCQGLQDCQHLLEGL